jgi:flagellar hook-length control protein FliK
VAPTPDAAKPAAGLGAHTTTDGPPALAAELEAAAPEKKPVLAPTSADETVAAAGQPQAAAESGAAHAPAPGAAVRGSPETVANFAAQIVRKLGTRTTQFDVQLTPAGLGKVDVRVEIGSDGLISAAMSFDNPQAAAELKSRAAELQRALADAGFDASGGLSFDVAGDSTGSNGGRQGPAQDGSDFGQALRGRAFRAALDNAGEAAQAAHPPTLNLGRVAASGVDVRI